MRGAMKRRETGKPNEGECRMMCKGKKVKVATRYPKRRTVKEKKRDPDEKYKQERQCADGEVNEE